MSSFFHVACRREGGRPHRSIILILYRQPSSRHLVFQGSCFPLFDIACPSISLLWHPSHLALHPFFLASGFACSIIYIILGYTTLLVWPLRTYSDRESSFLLVVNGMGDGLEVIGVVWCEGLGLGF